MEGKRKTVEDELWERARAGDLEATLYLFRWLRAKDLRRKFGPTGME